MAVAGFVEKTLLPSNHNNNNNNNNNNVTQYNFYFIEKFLIPTAETASFNKVKLNIPHISPIVMVNRDSGLNTCSHYW